MVCMPRIPQSPPQFDLGSPRRSGNFSAVLAEQSEFRFEFCCGFLCNDVFCRIECGFVIRGSESRSRRRELYQFVRLICHCSVFWLMVSLIYRLLVKGWTEASSATAASPRRGRVQGNGINQPTRRECRQILSTSTRTWNRRKAYGFVGTSR